jgi:hypothetical protein
VNNDIYENAQDRYDELSQKVQKGLRNKLCNRCDSKLELKGKIHYIVFSNKKVLWWHEGCPMNKKHG